MAIVKGVDTVSNVTNILTQIKNQGYSYVIRYYSINGNSKRMGAAGAAEIANAGLKRVSVYQNLHNSYSKFSAAIAAGDATDAIAQAKSVGHSSGTIYFAVDYDAYGSNVTNNVVPYFKEVNRYLGAQEIKYNVGVYASRVCCNKVSELNLAKYSYVRDMSYGSGGNMAVHMPKNWAFDQFAEITYNGIGIDKVNASGKDVGVSKLDEDGSN